MLKSLGAKLGAVLVLYGGWGLRRRLDLWAGSTGGRTRVGSGPRPGPSRPSSATATSGTSCSPRWGRRASCSCSARRSCYWGPVGMGHRPPSTSPWPGWGRSASSTWTSSTPPTCSARSCTTRTGSATARSTRPRRRSTPINPDVNVVTYDVRLGRGQHPRHHRRLRRHRRRHRQLPHPLPGLAATCSSGSPSCTARSSSSRGRSRVFSPYVGPATGA